MSGEEVSLQKTIESAKVEFATAKAGLLRALETTPDERLNWSPSSTARTPLAVFVHAADSVRHIHAMLDGRTYAVPTTAEAERDFRERERAFRKRDEGLVLFERNCEAYLELLDTLTHERLESKVRMPFGLGEAPMEIALFAAPKHTDWHTAQINYIQTVYGDHNWHIGR